MDEILKESNILDTLISDSIYLIEDSLNIINNLYESFSEEIRYDYRKSEPYKRSLRGIAFLKRAISSKTK